MARRGKPFLSFSITKGTLQAIKYTSVNNEKTPPEKERKLKCETNLDRVNKTIEIGHVTKCILLRILSGTRYVRIPNTSPNTAPNNSFPK